MSSCITLILQCSFTLYNLSIATNDLFTMSKNP